MKFVLAFVLFALAGTANAAPLEAYGALPSFEDVTLSPDGSKIAYVLDDAENARRLIVVRPSTGGEILGGVNAGDTKVRDLLWVDENSVVIVSSQTAHALGVMGTRQEYYQAVLFDHQSKRQFNIMRSVEGTSMNIVLGTPAVRLVGGRPMLFAQGIVFPDSEGRPALFAVDPTSGAVRQLDAKSSFAEDWLVDAGGNVVGAEDFRDRESRWSVRLRQDAGWKDIYNENVVADRPDVIGFSNDGAAILVRSYEGGKTVPKAFAVSDGSAVAVPPYEDGSGAAVLDRLTGRIVGYHYVGHNGVYEFIDAKDQAAWKKISDRFSGEQVEITSMSDDRSKIVVLVTGQIDGYEYCLFDGKTGTVTPLGPAYRDIDSRSINRVVQFNYATGDGRQLDAYLTLPHGLEAQNLPLIVLPHGGPAARDEPGFDWWSQALSSLGYAVLQPQFRGSDGFSWDLLSAGFGQWGRKMQTDLSDGVRALARTGIADPKRVCIVGASYGGYAALAGPTLDPGVYRCAVSVSGISDMREFIAWREKRTSAEHLQDRYWMRFAGASTPDDPVLDTISPIKHIAAVTVPVLLIHGKDDTVVPIEQSEDMADALKRAGKSVTFVKLDGEDHWLSRSATRSAMLKATVDFLKANNPP